MLLSTDVRQIDWYQAYFIQCTNGTQVETIDKLFSFSLFLFFFLSRPHIIEGFDLNSVMKFGLRFSFCPVTSSMLSMYTMMIFLSFVLFIRFNRCKRFVADFFYRYCQLSCLRPFFTDNNCCFAHSNVFQFDQFLYFLFLLLSYACRCDVRHSSNR